MEKIKPAVFLDRDGVINEDRADYVKTWAEFRFIRGVRPALRRLAEARIPVVVVTNQSAVGRGLISPEGLASLQARMVREIERSGGRIAGVFHCPHRPDEGCACRKPRAGLLQQAARELGLDLSRSLLVGDTGRDLEAGRRAGCRTMLVLSGQGRGTLRAVFESGGKPEDLYVCPDLPGAADLILGLMKNQETRTCNK
jgi:histidinol-phosphate phosphatase family protein